MSDSYSVKARLSATDSGFSSTLRNAIGMTDSFKSKISSIGTGILQGVGQSLFSSVTNGIRDMYGELNAASGSWKTFEGNMSMLGKSAGEISKVKNELSQFATDSIYSASDMATTYAQLAAVGVGNTTELVKGFGGLAAAAENPTQAMKTLSQQATQMAAKPNVAWQDFKLMLEQTPAGLSQVAKAMGMTTSELVKNVQDGTVATDDFFNAIVKAAGTGTELNKLATEYKTIDQAVGGLKETIATKLTPAFNVLSNIGIKAVSGIVDKLGKIDGEAIASKVSGWIKKAQPMWNSFAKAVSKVFAVISGVAKKLAPAFNSLRSTVSNAVKGILDKIGAINVDSVVNKIYTAISKAKPYFDAFVKTMASIAKAVSPVIKWLINLGKTIVNYLLNNSEQLSKLVPVIIGVVGAFKGFKIIKSLSGPVGKFAKSLTSMAAGGIKTLAAKLFGVAAGEKAAGTASATSAPAMAAAAKAFMMTGAGVLMAAGGFALLAQSAIALAAAGWPAIAVMGGLVIALAALMIGTLLFVNTLSASAAQMTAAGTAMMALGAAVLMIGAGFALLAFSAIALANAGWGAIAVMAGMVVVIALLAVGAAFLGTALTAGAIGFIAFGAALLMAGAGAVLLATSLVILSTCLPMIVQYGLMGAVNILALGAALLVFGAGALVAGAGALVLGAGLLVVTLAVTLLTVGVILLTAASLVLTAGLMMLNVSLLALSVTLPIVAMMTTLLTVTFTLAAAISLVLSAAILVLTASVLVFTATLLILTATMLIVTATMAALMAGAIVGGVGLMLFGTFALVACAGLLLFAAALGSVNSSMKSIAKNAKSAEKSVNSMKKSVGIVEAGLKALGNTAKNAMSALLNAFKKPAGDIVPIAMKIGTGFTMGLQAGLIAAPVVALSAAEAVSKALQSGADAAYSAGAFISRGFANGMLSCLAMVRSAAAQLAAEADKAVRAKAKIHSPSKVAAKLGNYWGGGYAGGLSDMANKVWDAAQDLVSIPNVATPNLAMAYSGELGTDYNYSNRFEGRIEVSLPIDGKEFARVTVPYTQAEMERRQTRTSRKHGEV